MSDVAEGTHDEQPNTLSRRVETLLGGAELALYLSTAVILTVGAATLLIFAVYEAVLTATTAPSDKILVPLLDRVLLVLMLAEVIYTVRRVAKTRRLELGPFFVIAIIAAIRRVLVITAESAGYDINDPAFQAASVELGLLALLIVAFAAAMRLVPLDSRPTT